MIRLKSLTVSEGEERWKVHGKAGGEDRRTYILPRLGRLTSRSHQRHFHCVREGRGQGFRDQV